MSWLLHSENIPKQRGIHLAVQESISQHDIAVLHRGSFANSDWLGMPKASEA